MDGLIGMVGKVTLWKAAIRRYERWILYLMICLWYDMI